MIFSTTSCKIFIYFGKNIPQITPRSHHINLQITQFYWKGKHGLIHLPIQLIQRVYIIFVVCKLIKTRWHLHQSSIIPFNKMISTPNFDQNKKEREKKYAQFFFLFSSFISPPVFFLIDIKVNWYTNPISKESTIYANINIQCQWYRI